MFISFEDRASTRTLAIKLLEKCKKYESEHSLHEKQIGNCVVMCKNEEQFKEFKKAIANPKMY